AERAVQVERIGVQLDGQPLAGHDLEGVARGDVLLDPAHRVLERGPGRAARERGVRDGRLQRERRGAGTRAQGADDVVQPATRLVEAASQLRLRGRVRDVDGRDRVRAAEQVVDGEDDVREEEKRFGQAEVVGRARGQPLEVADDIVADVADG